MADGAANSPSHHTKNASKSSSRNAALRNEERAAGDCFYGEFDGRKEKRVLVKVIGE